MDHQLAGTISSYWVNFVKTGNPNGYQLPVWPAFNNSTMQVMYLGEKPAAKPLADKAALDFIVSEMQK